MTATPDSAPAPASYLDTVAVYLRPRVLIVLFKNFESFNLLEALLLVSNPHYGGTRESLIERTQPPPVPLVYFVYPVFISRSSKLVLENNRLRK